VDGPKYNLSATFSGRPLLAGISLSTVEYRSVSRVYSTVDSDITYLIHGLIDCLERRLVLTVGCMCPVKREEGSCECKC